MNSSIKIRFRLFGLSLVFGTLFLVTAYSFPDAECGSIVSGPAESSSSTVYLLPDSSRILQGERCTLSVMVDQGTDSLSCAYCEITYDSTMLEIVSAGEGALYSETSFSTFFDWEVLYPGRVMVSNCVLGYRSYILAPGELFELVFEGKSDGWSWAEVDSATLHDIDRDPVGTVPGIPVDIYIGEVTGVDKIIFPTGSFTCRPNPFNPLTRITFQNSDGENPLASSGELRIYSPSGRIIRDLYRGRLNRGKNEFVWKGKDNSGKIVSAGLYIAALKADGALFTQKLILVR
ncbi:MAG: FlgD immunoglobulin-like domain containing protein [Candidatus Krumholzibacteriota bacterium]|nr:FlgD immunoglobulin-like domain containing protein [Candidatus Krumholzibacteriota bacterium]